MKFRTQYNAKENYNDDESNFGPSLTDASQYQSLDDIIKRCMRGVPVNIAQRTPLYEVNKELGSEEVESVLDSVTEGFEGADFDLSDVPGMIDRAKSIKKKTEEKVETPLVEEKKDVSEE